MKTFSNRVGLCLFLPLFVLFMLSTGPVAQEETKEGDVDRTIELVGKEYKFVPNELTVESGKRIKIIFKNEGTIAHDFFIKELDFQTEPIQPGNKTSYTFTAPSSSATLHFECKVAGHGPAGMKGTISVRGTDDATSGTSPETASDGSGAANASGNQGGNNKTDANENNLSRAFHERMSKRRNTSLPAGWGAVRGTVTLNGNPPEPYRNEGSSAFRKQCGFDGAFEIQYVQKHEKTGGLRNTLLYVRDLNASNDALRPPKNVRIVQRHCRFHPRVQVVRTGGTITLLNEDPAVHNFKYQPTKPLNSTRGNLIQKQGTDGPRKDEITIGTMDVYASQCNVHPWMNGLFLSIDHPGYDVTGKRGQFRIPLPPGTHDLRVRHYTEKKAKTVKVTVKEGEVTDRSIDLSME